MSGSNAEKYQKKANSVEKYYNNIYNAIRLTDKELFVCHLKKSERESL
jgi:hypothetical protein